MKEAIILGAGEAWRLKPHIWIPKAFLPIGTYTLLDFQIEWLRRYGFTVAAITLNKDGFSYGMEKSLVKPYKCSLEEEPLGTAGGLKKALKFTSSSLIYVMNIDDIAYYNPNELMKRNNAILVSKVHSPFGKVVIENNKVVGFEEKPPLDFYSSAGHYSFRRYELDRLLPDYGDLEEKVLPVMAKEGNLNVFKIDNWITINTMKDYLKIQSNIE